MLMVLHSNTMWWSLPAGLLLAANDAVSGMNDLPAWIQILERLGSFALIAFLIYYFVKVALPQQRQDYLASITEHQTAYLQAAANQRADYLKANEVSRMAYFEARKEDHAVLLKLAESAQKNAEATLVHVTQANMVWERQGVIPPKYSKTSTRIDG